MATSNDTYLTGLNPEQQAAVCYGDGQLLIFAGAGSGKTRVLTRRIARLVQEGHARADEILAVTFTNKAAREMKHRVQSLLEGAARPSGTDSFSLWVATFHSAAVRILRREAAALGYTESFAIYDSADSLSTIKRCFERLNIDPRVLSPRLVLSQIDHAKNSYQDPESFRAAIRQFDETSETIAALYAAYQEELYAANAMDFGDLLCNTVSLFELRPDLLAGYQQRFRHILIDEYQDTNAVQYKLIHMLAAHHRNLCVVGDDDQSIYAFRGATVENILNFQRDYPAAYVVTLETNYRSTKTILDAANAVISRNVKRQPKSMRTPNAAGERIVCYRTFDEQSEARWVADHILEHAAAGSSFNDIAIFYRTNAQSRAIEEALCERGIAYQIFGGQRFYDRKEIKDILAYYKLLLNKNDNEAFLRVINTPARGIGTTSIQQLLHYAQTSRLPLLPALEQACATDARFLSKPLKKKFEVFLEMLQTLGMYAHQAANFLSNAGGQLSTGEIQDAIAQLLRHIVEESGYRAALEKGAPEESQARFDNLQELYRVAIGFVRQNLEQHEPVSLESFLDRVSLVPEVERAEQDSSESVATGSVSLMTLHLAKGLEFEIVFLTGLEEGLLPHVRSLDSHHALEEERRLCYVGITRAKTQLYLSHACSRETFGKGSWYAGMQSRFLNDIPAALLTQLSLESVSPDDLDDLDQTDYAAHD